MSVSGLYESVKGDELARKSLAPFTRPYVDDEEHPTGRRPRRRCACGTPVGHAPKMRNGIIVCDACARKIAPKKGGVKGSTVCHKCGGTFPRSRTVLRQKALYCKACAADMPATSGVCAGCGKHTSNEFLVQRSKKKYCKSCAASVPRMARGSKSKISA